MPITVMMGILRQTSNSVSFALLIHTLYELNLAFYCKLRLSSITLGVINISNSLLLLNQVLRLNNLPIIGKSPKNGTFSTSLRSICSYIPPSTAVSPLPTKTCVFIF